jgi:protocatechuate 3,4-dioxygenase, alpha subunit
MTGDYLAAADAPSRPIATASQTVGPFFHFGLARNEALGNMAPPDAAGERLRLRVRVIDGDGIPLPDALIELYQADADGRYAQPAFSGFGRLATDQNGVCMFETIKPGAVPDGRGGLQAPHFNVCLFARGLLRHLYTRIYFDGDPHLATDPILALVPASRRATLVASRAEADDKLASGMRAAPDQPQAHTREFLIRLQGENETVFFDV